ncbi:WD40 repeat-like protein [Gigaspora margarita]|uniref:WD40 repeat-like protein n=1 Tax=Gigaspora margarita TaxID=4874 RepID=A0A8H4EKJ5_GIGMA|nr:WD40 repeat-like protein [Gigaspora margarita]
MMDSSDSSDDEPPEESKIRNEPDKHNDNESNKKEKDDLTHITAFNSNRTEIIAAGQKKYFYSFNIEARSIDKSNGVYGFQDKSLKNFSISSCVDIWFWSAIELSNG